MGLDWSVLPVVRHYPPTSTPNRAGWTGRPGAPFPQRRTAGAGGATFERAARRGGLSHFGRADQFP